MNPRSGNSSQSLTRRQFVGAMGALGTGLLPAVSASAFSPQPVAQPERTICIFSKHLHWLTLPEMAQTALKAGFQGIDLTVRKGGHVNPERVKEELPVAVSLIRKAGLEVPMIATDVIDADSPLSKSLLQTAGQLGIPYYRTGYLKYNPQLGIVKSLQTYKMQLQKLAALNQKYGLHGAYQNHSGTGVGASVWDIWELIKDIDPRWLGCQYDIKHAVAEGGYSWVNGLDVLKSHIRCMDIKDFVWAKKEGKWKDEVVPLGEGMVDFTLYFTKLKQYGISGPMSMHYEYPLGGAETGKQQLSIPPEDVLTAIKRDLQMVHQLIKQTHLDE